MGTYSGTPRTWSAGETLTAALMNSDVRDPLSALAGASNSYTPTVTGWTLNNGTATGNYLRIGKLVLLNVVITAGSGTSFAANPGMSVPSGLTATRPWAVGCRFYDSSANNNWYGNAWVGSSITVYVSATNGINNTVDSTTPFTWATSDRIEVWAIYETA